MATEAFVYDALRTPRGKGKKNGSLHEVKPVDLVVGLLDAVKERNPCLDVNRVDDVVLGVVSPIGDQGGDIAKTAALAAGYPDTVAGVQLNRFCASGLEAVNQAASRVRGGFEDLILAGGVESMSRVAMGSDGGAWASDPATAFATAFVPQGIGADLIATIEGCSREDVDTFAVESNHRAAKAWADGRFAGPIVPVKDHNGVTVLDHDEFIKPESTVEGLARLKPSFAGIGDQAGSTPWRWRSTTGSRRSTTSTTPATAPASSTAPRWWRSATSRSARTSVSTRGPGSSPPRSPAPTRRSC